MFVLNEQNSIANHFLAEIRGVESQKDGMRFRRNLERLGEIMAYEISKGMDYEKSEIATPLGSSELDILKESPILVSIMRAGLPYFQGFLNFFDQAKSGFIGSGRVTEGNAEEIKVASDYFAIPEITNQKMILIDPMLATGKSVVQTIEDICKKGNPSHIYIAAVVASQQGIEYIKEHLKVNFSIWTCAVDEHLNNKAYIVPGLGDAGDLSYGLKN